MSKDYCAYPKCKKELTHTQGRRKKKYCDQNCNTRHWQMLHPKHKSTTKRIPIEVWKEMELAKLKVEGTGKGANGWHIDIDKLEATELPPPPPSTENTAPDAEEIKKQIAAIRNEKLPSHRSSTLGRKSWEREQAQRISELQKKLNPI